MSRNIQLLLAYDGTDFHGWQRQPQLRTVQGEVESVIRRVVRHPLDLIASGRTDAGVHAAGQVVNFSSDIALPCDKLAHAIGSRLPPDVALLRARDVPAGFHATRSARSKLYRYRLFNRRRRPVQHFEQRYVHHYYHFLDIPQMRRGARHFVGTQDFRALASKGSAERPSYVRTVLCCEVYPAGEEIRIDVRGTGFLYNQVRNMVGTLLEIGRGRWEPDRVRDILASRDRTQAGPTVSARGLCLQWVEYPPDRLLVADRVAPQPTEHSLERCRFNHEDLPRHHATDCGGSPGKHIADLRSPA